MQVDLMKSARGGCTRGPRGRPGALTCAGACDSRTGGCVDTSSRLALGYWTTGDTAPLFTWTVGALLWKLLPCALRLRDLGRILC